MKYLVLRAFKSYGVYYHKGDIVDAAKIKSPRLRQAEGKIIVANEVPTKSAVPSSPSSEEAAGAIVPAADSEPTPSDVTTEDNETGEESPKVPLLVFPAKE